jgi:signal transduction histidine kinase
VALILVGISLFYSNTIVTKVHQREKQRATQWADAIQKKVELVELTDSTFSRLRDKEREKMELWIEATKEVSQMSSMVDFQKDYSFPLEIINRNKDIPVILLDDLGQVSGSINLDFDAQDLRVKYPDKSIKQNEIVFEDSLKRMAEKWSKINEPFTVEIFDDLFMTYYYSDSKEIRRLERERDSLIISFSNELLNNDGLVPVILVDEKTQQIIGSNLDDYSKNEVRQSELKKRFNNKNEPIEMTFGNSKKYLLYYEQSNELTQLQYFPIVQFTIIGLFVLIAYLIFSTFRKAEQNQVWAGMAKETAHQLGTPLSSLMAWIELLDANEANQDYTFEMRKDILRLEKVTDRFSKIGSEAKLNDLDIVKTIQQILEYLRPRISKQVKIEFDSEGIHTAPHNGPLLEWVIENIVKNAVDAMEAKGFVKVSVSERHKVLYIDIQDSGKGISNKKLKTVFQPGYSTKKRGWGLGLSLVKRIIVEYHKGNVFVLRSELNKGTTFRVSLPK